MCAPSWYVIHLGHAHYIIRWSNSMQTDYHAKSHQKITVNLPY